MLQGTFDTLSLTEVLRMLASSGTSGGLHVLAGADTGAIWVAEGSCRAVEHDGARGPVPAAEVADRLVRLGAAVARHPEGAFRFVDGEVPPWQVDEPVPVLDALPEIDHVLAVWREVQRTVPSLDMRPLLRADLRVPELRLDRERWGLVVAIAGARRVRDLVAETGHDDLWVCRALAELVDAGVVVLEAGEPATVARPLGRGVLAEAPYGPGVDEPHHRPETVPATRGE